MNMRVEAEANRASVLRIARSLAEQDVVVLSLIEFARTLGLSKQQVGTAIKHLADAGVFTLETRGCGSRPPRYRISPQAEPPRAAPATARPVTIRADLPPRPVDRVRLVPPGRHPAPVGGYRMGRGARD